MPNEAYPKSMGSGRIYWEIFRSCLKKLCFPEDSITLGKLFNLCKPQFNHEAENIYLMVLMQGFKEMMQSRKINITKAFSYLKEKKIIPSEHIK